MWNRKKNEPQQAGKNESAAELLLRARVTDDPVARYALLARSEALSPDDLAVNRALLMQGRLHERNPKRLDYSIIKCHLLHFLEPEERVDETETARCVAELFGDARLLRCLRLAPDADVFLKDYVDEMAREYVRIFIMGSTRYARGLLGFTLSSRQPKYMAPPVAGMIRRALSCEAFTRGQALMLARALHDAFERLLLDTRELDVRLGADTLAELADHAG